MDTFTNLVAFPKYAFSATFKSILGAFLLFIVSIFVVDLVKFEYIIYIIVGSVLFSFAVACLGLLFLARRMKIDILNIADCSLDILRNAITDFNKVGTQISQTNRSAMLKLLFNGIIQVVTIPVIVEVVRKKVPLVGTMISNFIERVLENVSERISFKNDGAIGGVIEESVSDTSTNFLGLVNVADNRLKQTLNKSYKVAKIPLIVMFLGTVLILLAFIFYMN